jgi:uncharacterized OB-fold protein
MTEKSICPDFSALEIAMDSWSEPFWQAGAEGRLLMQKCSHCGTFRWPASAFCPQCRRQGVEWVPPGQARIYSYTVLPVRGADTDAPPQWRIPALVEFEDAPGVRLVSVLAGADPQALRIGDPVEVEWHPAANGVVPVFRLKDNEHED